MPVSTPRERSGGRHFVLMAGCGSNDGIKFWLRTLGQSSRVDPGDATALEVGSTERAPRTRESQEPVRLGSSHTVTTHMQAYPF